MINISKPDNSGTWPLALLTVGTLFPAKVNSNLPAKVNFPPVNLYAYKESPLGLILEKY
jgi:hypothetical protein